MANITIITGQYGCGKSEFSIQFALYLKNKYRRNVYIADADVVNVYFRSREQTEFLKSQGIEVIGNVLGSEANTDVPHFAPNFYNAISDDNAHLIVDLAGSEVGLRMIKSFLLELVNRNSNSYEFLYILNCNRDGNTNVEEVELLVNWINAYSDLKISGFVNNSHLMQYSSCDDYYRAQNIVKSTSLPIEIKYTLISDQLKCSNLDGELIEFDQLYLKKF